MNHTDPKFGVFCLNRCTVSMNINSKMRVGVFIECVHICGYLVAALVASHCKYSMLAVLNFCVL